jgi:hypothetical protein
MHGCHQRSECVDLLLLGNSEQRFKVALATSDVGITMRYEFLQVSTADRNLFFILEGCRKVHFQCPNG